MSKYQKMYNIQWMHIQIQCFKMNNKQMMKRMNMIMEIMITEKIIINIKMKIKKIVDCLIISFYKINKNNKKI